MSEQEVRVITPDGAMRTFLVHPDSAGPFPVAVLFMNAVGYREQIRANARRFASAGFYAAAPDLYYRSGDGITLDMTRLMSSGMESPEVREAMEIVASVTNDRVERDVAALVDYLKGAAADTTSLVCVGYCMGAQFALHVASTRDDMRAAAGIHPGALVTDEPDSPHLGLRTVHGELYMAFAEHDQTATPESIDAFRAAMTNAGVRGTVERLPGTAHGFAMADLPVYNHDACEHHFEETIALWRRSLDA